MPSTTQVTVDVIGETTATVIQLRISLLPKDQAHALPAPLLDESATLERDLALHPVQLLESHEYRYEFLSGVSQVPIETNLPEIFHPDTSDGRSGRIKTALFTGAMSVQVLAGGKPLGHFAVEVRSRKLDYLSQYRWMLRDLTEELSAVIMERFAATQQRFSVDDVADASTLYQRFCFLRSLFESETFVAALQYTLARPYHAWVDEPEEQRAGTGLRTSSSVVREIQRAGPRVPWEQHGHPTFLTSLPQSVRVFRSAETLDNAPNRFLKFVLTSWRSEVAVIFSVLSAESASSPVRRGLREVEAALDVLDHFLAAELFREVGTLTHFPAGNQVLLRRGGYREVFHSYLQSELAAKLAWEGGEHVYGAGQKNVAALYEYWAFLQLAKVISSLCQNAFDFGALLEVTNGGLNLSLKRGRHHVLSGSTVRLGRAIRVELWFNRSFGKGAHASASWSQLMRPDYSLLLTPHQDESSAFEPVWLHFDAKYRIDKLREVLGDNASNENRLEADGGEATGMPLRADLLKMHAYRDAIRRSAGAYILYPGTETEALREYHEILPGLGAFALRPTEEGDAQGASALAVFIDDVLTHTAFQLTQHERGRHWRHRIYSSVPPEVAGAPAAPFLAQPPADTRVLLGYVRNSKHYTWIRQNKLYNLRADRRTGSVGLGAAEMVVEFVALYGRGLKGVSLWRVWGEPQLTTRKDMLARNYPRPGGLLYYCLPLEPISQPQWLEEIHLHQLQRLLNGHPIGAPRTVRWDEIVRHGYDPTNKAGE